MMKPSTLRAFMQRHGNLGVLAVGIYLVVHHWWHRRRPTTVFVVCGLLSLGVLLYPKQASAPSPPAPRLSAANVLAPHDTKKESVRQTVMPHGTALFDRAKTILRAEKAWSSGGWGHPEY